MNQNGYFSRVRERLGQLSQDFPVYTRVVRGGIWKVGGTAYVSLLSVLLSALLTRYLSPAAFGEYTYTLSVVVTFSTIARMGFGDTVIREVAGALGRDAPEQARSMIQEILKWSGISLLLGALIFLLFGEDLGLSASLLGLVILWALVLSAHQLLVDVIRGFQKSQFAALLHGGRIGGPIAATIAVVLVFVVAQTKDQLTLRSAVLILIAGAGASLLISGTSLVHNVRHTLGGFSWKIRGPSLVVLGLALPVLMHSVASTVQTQSSVFVLKAFQPESDIAIFGTAQQLATFLMIQQNIVLFVLSPEIASLYAGGKIRKMEQLLRRSAGLALLPTLIGYLIFIGGGKAILGLLYGEFYTVGYLPLLVLSSGYLCHVFSGSAGLTLVMTGHQLQLMKISLLAAFLSVGLAVFLVQPLGVVGVAIATTLGYILKNVMMIISVKRRVGIWTFASLRWGRSEK
jgi:O-antigen/teichoic acid export membrane protein